MKMGRVDWKESENQIKAAKNKTDKEEADLKKLNKQQKENAEHLEMENQAKVFLEGGDNENNVMDDDDNLFDHDKKEKGHEETVKIVDILLEQKLGDKAYLVKR